jgi:hypothetical protein
VALLVLTALMLWREPRSELPLVGLVAAVSPAVLYVAATINPSGPEITAAACFGAGLMAAADPALAGRAYPWVVAAIGGTVLAACRPLGPAFVLLSVAAVVGLIGWEGVRATLRRERRPAVAATVPVALAALLNLAWEIARDAHPHVTAGDIGPGLRDAGSALPSLGQQLVGSFGSYDLHLPLIAYLGWGAVIVTVLALALRVGAPRERAVLLGLVGTVFGLVCLLSVTQRPTGFAVQTRYVLPVVALGLVLAGEVLRPHGGSVSPRVTGIVLVGVCVTAAAVHAAGWVAAATGWDTYISGVVEPPGGWAPWAVVMSVGVAALAAAGFVARRADSLRRRSPTPSRP